jgi:hypothetical protein
VPLGPTVPTAAPSSTFAFRATTIEPRCVRLTARPDAVSIVIVFPFVGTVPAKLTTPDAGASTGAPSPAPIAMPRCWPAAYGCDRSKEKVCKTGPSTGHVHAPAAGTNRSKSRTSKLCRRMTTTAFVVLIENSAGTVAAASAVVQSAYSEPR